MARKCPACGCDWSDGGTGCECCTRSYYQEQLAVATARAVQAEADSDRLVSELRKAQATVLYLLDWLGQIQVKGELAKPDHGQPILKRITELMDALTPFAVAFSKTYGDEYICNLKFQTPEFIESFDGNTVTPKVTAGDFRRAFEAVRKTDK